MKSPRKRQFHSSNQLDVVCYVSSLDADPDALPDRSVWFGQQHRNCCVGSHAGQEVGCKSTSGWISTEQWIVLGVSISSFNQQDASSSSYCWGSIPSKLSGLHPVKEKESDSRCLKSIIDRLPSASLRLRSDATDCSVRNGRNDQEEHQDGSFHAHIILHSRKESIP